VTGCPWNPGNSTFTGSLSPNWTGRRFSIAYVFAPQDPAQIVHRSQDRDGKPLALWYKEADATTIGTFESHVASVNNEKAAAAAATPVERAPIPVLDEAMKSRVRKIYEEIVAKKGPPKKRRSSMVKVVLSPAYSRRGIGTRFPSRSDHSALGSR
jgi:hypothetical protein